MNNYHKIHLTIRNITKSALVAACYVLLVYAFNFLSYGYFQFRFAEILMLLCFYNRRWSIALVIGCFIANCFSPYGLYDVLFGTLATLIACLTMKLTKNIWVSSILVPIANIIVGIEIALINGFTFWPSIGVILSIMISEFIVVTIIGVPIFKLLTKNEIFLKQITDF